MKNKKSMYAIISVVLGIIIAAILLVFITDGESGYIKICDFDFNSKDSGVSEMAYDSWNKTDGAKFSYSQNGGMDDSGCLVIETKNEDDARYKYTYDEALENTYYRMSVWLKTENVGENEGTVGANVSVLNTFNKSKDYKGTNDWTYIEYYGKTAKGQTDFTVCLRLGFYGGTNTGKVYFDDFKLEQLEELPKGAKSFPMGEDNGASGETKEVEQHSDTMLTATIMIISLIIIFVIVYKYALKNEKEDLKNNITAENKTFLKLNVPSSIVILLLFGFILRVVMSGTMPQCDIDVNLFQYWGNKLSEFGIVDFYSHAKEVNCDYPPLFMYYLYIIGSIASKFGITDSVVYDMMLKLPSIIADIIIAYMIYKIAHNKMHKNWTLFVVSLWLFNPMVILDSACWGQVDSILALGIFAAVYFITKEDYIFSAVAIAFSIALKPQGMFIVPILGFALLRRLICRKELSIKERVMPMVYSVGAFVLSFLAVMLPFGIKMKPNIFKWIFDMYLGTANGYEYATVNSFDFFYLLDGNWVKDDTELFFGMSYFQIGMAFVVLICLLIGIIYIMAGFKKPTINKKNKFVDRMALQKEQDDNIGQIYLFSAAMLYAVTMFAPRMHERYFYPALILLLAAVVYSRSKILLGVFSVMSISSFYTVLEIMTGISIGRQLLDTDYKTAAYYYWPPINWYRWLLAFINVAIAVALMFMAFMSVFGKKKENKKLLIWERKEEKGDKNEK